MLSAAVMAPTVTRSSLEMMLDSIRQRDEQPKDAPPALPARPVSRGRLPSSRRTVPKIGNNGKEYLLMVCEKKVAKNGDVAPVGDANMPELVSYEDDRVQEKVAVMVNNKLQTLEGINEVHECFHGLQARLCCQELEKGVTTLQSFVRGERGRYECEILTKRVRAVIVIQKHVKQWIARKKMDDHLKNIIVVQSVVRGWIVRKRYEVLQCSKRQKLDQESGRENPSTHNLVIADLQSQVQKAQRALREREEENITLQQKLQQYEKKLKSMEETWQEKVISLQDFNKVEKGLHDPINVELQSRVVSAEAALKQREEENATLHQQLQQCETRWSEYEVKMKSMEEMWQKQMTSLQMSLAAARKSLTSDNSASQNKKSDSSMISQYSDFEDMPAEAYRHEALPAKQQHKPDVGTVRSSDGNSSAVSSLAKEFEQQKKLFEDDVGSLIEVKLGDNSDNNDDEELRKLKVRFATWKKDYKVRLQDAKMALRKLHNSGSRKSRKSWWCSRS